MSSDVISKKKTEHAVLTIFEPYSVKGFQAVGVYLGYFSPPVTVALALLISVIVYGPIHWAISLSLIKE